MKNNVTHAIMFVTGLAIGSVIAWKITEKKYRKIADEEIASIKEVYSRLKMETNSMKEETPSETTVSYPEDKPVEYTEPVKTAVTKYYTIVDDIYGNNQNKEKEDPKMLDPEIYVISPDEFGDNPDYEIISLIYYANKVLTDDEGEVIDEPDLLIGPGSLETFGQYEDDSVFVVDNENRIYYEILADRRTYEADDFE